jgi:ribose 5-phosphate isomerase B
MKIVFAADPFALSLRKAIVDHLKQNGHEVIDFGASEDNTEIQYYESCVKACEALQRGEGERAILLCGTGMGMNVIANRFKGVRAAVVESVFAARMCRAINDANALCLGAMIWGDWMACEAVDVFLKTKLGDGLEDLKEFLQQAAKTVEKIDP